MKKLINSSFYALFFLAFSFCNAQNTVIKKDTLEGTELSITTDKNISSLLDNLEKGCATKESTVKKTEKSDHTASSNTTNSNKNLSNAEICRKNPRILGYKIQLVVVKSKEEADEVAQYFRRRFPYIKVQLDASLRPNYKVLAGSYFTKEAAASDLRNIRGYFKSAIPVKYMIFCTDAL
ncbi:SPOR domain-containing protein [Riemerella anatipestifer]|uniref:SPOR domain-containing protein n=1 Tax=Riemerella anatipestifer TaxID=34085 RepID=UPI002A856CEF|nr:SPOR domain-containing protein [Riemerella anatipestifer]